MKTQSLTTRKVTTCIGNKPRKSVTCNIVSLSVLATLGATMLLSINPAVAIAQGNDTDQFDINEVLVEQSSNGNIRAQDVALDPAGNRYVFGNFTGTIRFGEDPDVQELTGTDGDIFIAKYAADSSLLWVQKFDAFVSERLPATQPTGIKYDDTFKSIYIAGSFIGQLAIGSASLTANKNANGFVAQLDAETGVAQWANQIVSDKSVSVGDLSTNGNLAVTGSFNGIAEFNGQNNSEESLLALSANDSDMYTALYAFDGSLSFVLQAGGDGAEGNSVDLGSTITVGGDFFDIGRFPDRTGKPQAELVSNGKRDGFVVSYTLGGQRRFVKQIGGRESDSVRQVVNSGVQIHAAGNFRGQISTDQSDLVSRGNSDVFIAQLNNLRSGSVDAITQIGGTGFDFVHSLDADSTNRFKGSVFVGGEFASESLIVGKESGTLQIEHPDGNSGKTATYVAALAVEPGNIQPAFAQAVAGKFTSRGLTVNESGTDIFLPGRFTDAVTFGNGNRKIELQAPRSGTAMAIAHFTPAMDDGGGDDNRPAILVSSSSRGSVDGINFRDEDVLIFSPQRQQWAMFFDGSDVGLGGATDVDAFHQTPNGSMLLSLNRPITLPGVGNVDDSDILLFTPEQLGADTRGSLTIFLRGADVGLSTNGEDIDAIAIDTNGRLVVSVRGTARVPGANSTLIAQDEDLIAFNGGVWELVLDGSGLGLTLRSEDINGVFVNSSGIAITTSGAYDTNDIAGPGGDILICGIASGCSLLFDSVANGIGNEIIDAISLQSAAQ